MSTHELKQALADHCKESNLSPEKALAELAAELMLSETADSLHVYGPAFISEMDHALLQCK